MVGWKRSLTNAALVTALCVRDLSCQGKSPGRENSQVVVSTISKELMTSRIREVGRWFSFSLQTQLFVTTVDREEQKGSTAWALQQESRLVTLSPKCQESCWKVGLETRLGPKSPGGLVSPGYNSVREAMSLELSSQAGLLQLLKLPN